MQMTLRSRSLSGGPPGASMLRQRLLGRAAALLARERDGREHADREFGEQHDDRAAEDQTLPTHRTPS
ncbi:MAG: hypothetical protein ACK4V6_04700 [Microthrixaceae bacterium]